MSLMQQLRDQQIAAGATLATDRQIPLSFGNEEIARSALQSGVVLSDRSHWGRIQVSGADRIRFLHNQTTNNFNSLSSGQGCETVFVTSTARTIDLTTAYVLDDAVLLLTSPDFNQRLIAWMDRFIFFADKVELQDLTDRTATFTVMGPASDALMENLGAGTIIGQPKDSHQLFELNGISIRIAVGSSLAIPGYTLMVDAEQAATLWQRLVEVGAVPMGDQLWQQLRIEQGRPAPGLELTDDYNPLEAGLWHTISLSKGCYIGQETIARLHTYRGVKQQLWGVQLTEAVEPNSVVMAGEEKVGHLTSCTPTANGYFGLAYIRTKNVEPGLKVTIGLGHGELVALPFVSHEYL